MGYARLLDHTVHDLYVWMSESVGWGVSKKGREEKKFHYDDLSTPIKSILVAPIPSGPAKATATSVLFIGGGGFYPHMGTFDASNGEASIFYWMERERGETTHHVRAARIVIVCA